MLRKITISNYTTTEGLVLKNLPLSFQCFGRELGTAPIILINHALTGNSAVGGKNGWWYSLVDHGKCIDLNRFSVLCFDIPGNGFNGYLIKEYQAVSIRDVAHWFLEGLGQLGVKKIFAGIGGSLGGNILWQMAAIKPELFEHIIPIATDWKATDWVIAQCRVQRQILENSLRPLHDARVHAMTFYRTAKSFKEKFNLTRSEILPLYNVESWLLHHGGKLEQRFHLQAYKLMNHLLMTANIETDTANFQSVASQISGAIHLIGIDTDGFYLNEEILQTYHLLKSTEVKVHFYEINSIHGHDAFLIEYEQLREILDPILNPEAGPAGIQETKRKKHEYATIG